MYTYKVKQRNPFQCSVHKQHLSILCAHPACASAQLCNECLKNHTNKHQEYLILFEDLFKCAIMKKLNKQCEIDKRKKPKKPKKGPNVEHLISEINEAFQQIEQNFIAKLFEAKESVTRKLLAWTNSDELNKTDLNTLEDLLQDTYSKARENGFCDEIKLNEYIVMYEKAFNTLNERTFTENSKSVQDNIPNIYLSHTEQLLTDFKIIINDYAEKIFTNSQENILVLNNNPIINIDSNINSDANSNTHSNNNVNIEEDDSKLSPQKAKLSSEPENIPSIIEQSSIIEPNNNSIVEQSSMIKLDLAPLLKNLEKKKEDRSINRSKPRSRRIIDAEDRHTWRSKSTANIVKDKERSASPEITFLKAPNKYKVAKYPKRNFRLVNNQFINTSHQGISVSPLYIKEQNCLITAGKEGYITLWDASSFEIKGHVHTENVNITCLKYILKRNLLAVGFKDSSIQIFDYAEDCNYVGILKGHHGPVSALEYSESLDRLISSSSLDSKPIKYWDLDEMKADYEYSSGDTEIYSLVYLQEKDILVAGLCEGQVHFFDAREKQVINILDTSFGFKNKNKDVISLSIDSRQTTLYCGNLDGAFSSWNVTLSPPKPVGNFRNALVSARFNFVPEKRLVIIISKDKQIRIQDLLIGKNLNELQGGEENGSNLAYIPDLNKLLVIDPRSTLIKTYDLKET